ncbi:MAG: hypothetical protein ABIV21_00620, partial [Pyrinomonadaceae bacterium]
GNIPPATNGLSISTAGRVTIGNYSGNIAKLSVGGADEIGVSATTANTFESALRGFNTSTGSGVSGSSSIGTGVAGTSNNGTGVFAFSSLGFALDVEGNARQRLSKGGFVKAMALIRVTRTQFPATAVANVLRCYNSVNNSSTGTCGFTFPAVYTSFGVDVNLGMFISDRFISLTGNSQNTPSIVNFVNDTTVSVLDGSGTTEFYIFVF